ncbi:unnamed protein product [Jaminaea pallidilutea]
MDVNNLTILQLNSHRSTDITHTLLNDRAVADKVDIICIQEPFAVFTNPIGHHAWTPYGDVGPAAMPTTDFPRETPLPAHPRVLFYVNNRLRQADVSLAGHVHPDFATIQVQLSQDAHDDATQECPRSIYIHNVYNPATSSDTLAPLFASIQSLNTTVSNHHLLIGDLNVHHPWWETDDRRANKHAEAWALALSSMGLELLTPRDAPTFTDNRGGQHTNDLAFANNALAEHLLHCDINADWNCGSDHEAVVTTFDLSARTAMRVPKYNMRRCDGQAFAGAARANFESRWGSMPSLAAQPEVWVDALIDSITQALQATTPMTRPCPHSKPWYNTRLNQLRSACNKLRRTWQVERDERSRTAYNRIRNAFRSAVRQAKKDATRQALAQPQDGLWRLAQAKKRNGATTLVATLTAGNHRAATAEAKEAVLRNKFFPDSAQLPPQSSHTSADSGEQSAWQWQKLTGREVQHRIARSKKDTAPGTDGITWSAHRILAAEWPNYCYILAGIFNACLEAGVHPAAFKRARTIVLRKPNKPDYSSPGAYRPITLLPTTAKLLEALVASRVLQHAEINDTTLASHHYGGRPNRASEDATLQIAQFISDAHAAKRAVGMLTVDVSGAYNAVQQAPLMTDMATSGWPPLVRRWVASFMQQRTTQLQVGDHIGEVFDSSGGLPQGSPISQLLWLAYSRGLVEAAGDNTVSDRRLSIGWVDDWTVLITGRTGRELNKRFRNVARHAEQWRLSHGAIFDADKSSTMIVQRPRTIPLTVQPVRLGSMTAELVNSAKILGVTFQADAKFDEHAALTASKATRATGTLMHWGSRTWGFSFENARRLYLGAIVPMMTYASSTWMPGRGTDRRGRASYLAQAAKVQRGAAIQITGAFRSTSTEALNYEANLLPVAELFDLVHARSLIRLKTVPQHHPLAVATNRACKKRIRSRHTPPLQGLARAHPSIARARIDRRAKPREPQWAPPQTHVAADKDEATAQHSHHTALPPNAIHIYSDGSKSGAKVGAAAAWRECDGWRVARRALREGDTVMQAELCGIDLAVDMLKESAAHPTECTVWLDSQAAIRAIGNVRSSERRVREVQDKLLDMATKGWNICVRWLPGHVGIEGNEKADEEARRASDELPSEAEKQRGVSPATLLNKAKAECTERWRQSFALNQNKATDLRAIVGRGRLGHTAKLHRGLGRAQSSLLTQLRTGHGGFGTYLAGRKAIDTPQCECGHPRESRQHILLSCRLWRLQQRQLQATIRGRYIGSLRQLLDSDPATVHATLRFASHRFLHYAGHPPTDSTERP